jgi:hypothetical protein
LFSISWITICAGVYATVVHRLLLNGKKITAVPTNTVTMLIQPPISALYPILIPRDDVRIGDNICGGIICRGRVGELANNGVDATEPIYLMPIFVTREMDTYSEVKTSRLVQFKVRLALGLPPLDIFVRKCKGTFWEVGSVGVGP